MPGRLAIDWTLTVPWSWCKSGTDGRSDVPQIEVSDQQIIDALDRLSPKGRREAVRRLIAGASVLDRTIDALQPRIVEVARQRVSTGRSSPMKNASVSWTTSSTNDRGILQSRFRHEHSGLRSLLEGASIPVHACSGVRPRDADHVRPDLDRIL